MKSDLAARFLRYGCPLCHGRVVPTNGNFMVCEECGLTVHT